MLHVKADFVYNLQASYEDWLSTRDECWVGWKEESEQWAGVVATHVHDISSFHVNLLLHGMHGSKSKAYNSIGFYSQTNEWSRN